MGRKSKYTKEILEEVVKISLSITEVLRNLGVEYVSGSMHYHISKRIKSFDIDTSHFTGQRWNKGRTFKKMAKEEVLVYNRLGGKRQDRNTLKRCMLESDIEYVCSMCGCPDEWNGKPLTIEIDHINGDPLDDRIENLRFLCPNCHSQEETSNRTKNKKVKINKQTTKPKKIKRKTPKRKVKETKEPKKCTECGTEINNKSKKCPECHCKSTRKFEVTKEELEKLIEEMLMTKIGEMFGVSDNAVKKRAKKLGIELKNRRGYWQKKL